MPLPKTIPCPFGGKGVYKRNPSLDTSERTYKIQSEICTIRAAYAYSNGVVDVWIRDDQTGHAVAAHRRTRKDWPLPIH